MTSGLDLNDPAVLDMADRNHRPQESWTFGGVLRGVSCEQCHRQWPCPTRNQVDNFKTTRSHRHE